MWGIPEAPIVTSPKSLIINSPYTGPNQHWIEHKGSLELKFERRLAGHEISTFAITLCVLSRSRW